MSVGNSKQSNQAGPIRILIVDDHPLVRLSLREFIRREKDMEVCGEAEDREQALALVAATKPHLAIVDLTLKSSNGMELIKDLRDQFPGSADSGVVHARRDHPCRTGDPRRGAGLHHETGGDDQGDGGDPPDFERRNLLERTGGGQGGLQDRGACAVRRGRCLPTCLTDRELQVFEMIGAGRSTRQIAAALHIDVSTVETYRARIKEKLNLKDSLALLQYAIRWHISNAR